MIYKNYELVHGENEKSLAVAVNQKLEEGYTLIGDPKIIPLNYAKTAIGFEIQKKDFFQAVAQIVE